MNNKYIEILQLTEVLCICSVRSCDDYVCFIVEDYLHSIINISCLHSISEALCACLLHFHCHHTQWQFECVFFPDVNQQIKRTTVMMNVLFQCTVWCHNHINVHQTQSHQKLIQQTFSEFSIQYDIELWTGPSLFQDKSQNIELQTQVKCCFTAVKLLQYLMNHTDKARQ